jgi:hypothetical protein
MAKRQRHFNGKKPQGKDFMMLKCCSGLPCSFGPNSSLSNTQQWSAPQTTMAPGYQPSPTRGKPTTLSPSKQGVAVGEVCPGSLSTDGKFFLPRKNLLAYYDRYAPDRAGNADAILRILPAEEIAKQLSAKYGYAPTMIQQQISSPARASPLPVSSEKKQSLAQQKMALIEKMKRIQAETATLEKLHQQIQTNPAEKADLMSRLQQLKRATAQIKEDTAIFKSQFQGASAATLSPGHRQQLPAAKQLSPAQQQQQQGTQKQYAQQQPAWQGVKPAYYSTSGDTPSENGSMV